MEDLNDQNPIESEESTEETPSVAEEQASPQFDPKAYWSKLTDPSAKAEQTPETPVEEVVEQEAKEKSKPKEASEPVDPLANDPKLVKRFRDSQNFIATLKDENKNLTQQLADLKSQMNSLSEAVKAKQETPSQPVTQGQVNEVFQDIMDQLPDSVKEEVETFPELFKGIDLLIKHRLSSANKAIEGDLELVRKSNQERFVQQRLNERHGLANRELGITNARDLDMDDPVFAQWVLSSPSRKQVVLDFGNSAGFVDLMRSFLFDYPELAARPQSEQETARPVETANTSKRRLASHAIPVKPAQRNREPRRLESIEDKQAFWGKLTSASA